MKFNGKRRGFERKLEEGMKYIWRKIWIIRRWVWTFWICRFFCFCIFWGWDFGIYLLMLIFFEEISGFLWVLLFTLRSFSFKCWGLTTSLGTWLFCLIVKFSGIWPFWVRSYQWWELTVWINRVNFSTGCRTRRRRPTPITRSSCDVLLLLITILPIHVWRIIFIGNW